jgi:chemotaxis methyl-accepting protein methylase
MWQERISRLIEARTGLVLSETTKQRLDSFVARRCTALGLATVDKYVGILEAGQLPAEFQEIVNTVTVSKTAFFRYPKHIDAVCRLLLPSLDKVLDAEKPFHIWCAAVSSGEEVYSLAMALEHSGWFHRRSIKLRGTDINDLSLARAKRGEYHLDKATQETLPEYACEYLEAARGENRFRVVEHVRARVELAHANLNALTTRTDEAWHVVLCCNVLIYFDETNRRRVISDIQARMAEHAALLLGGAEIAGATDPRYRVRNVGGCFAHLRGAWPGLTVSDLRDLMPRPPAASPGAAAAAKSLHTKATSTPRRTDAQPSSATSNSVGPGPTFAHIHPRAEAATSETDSWRVRARDCLNANKFAEACAVLETARERDPFCEEAHFLYGRALRALGRRDEAESAFRRAVFLDPDFALARYELGFLRHLQGDFAAALREYQRVLGSLSSRGGRGPKISGNLDLEEARGIEKFMERMCIQNRELALAGVLPESAQGPT